MSSSFANNFKSNDINELQLPENIAKSAVLTKLFGTNYETGMPSDLGSAHSDRMRSIESNRKPYVKDINLNNIIDRSRINNIIFRT